MEPMRATRRSRAPCADGAPVGDRDTIPYTACTAKGTLGGYLETPQKWGQISVVASIPESAGEAMLYV